MPIFNFVMGLLMCVLMVLAAIGGLLLFLWLLDQLSDGKLFAVFGLAAFFTVVAFGLSKCTVPKSELCIKEQLMMLEDPETGNRRPVYICVIRAEQGDTIKGE